MQAEGPWGTGRTPKELPAASRPLPPKINAHVNRGRAGSGGNVLLGAPQLKGVRLQPESLLPQFPRPCKIQVNAFISKEGETVDQIAELKLFQTEKLLSLVCNVVLFLCLVFKYFFFFGEHSQKYLCKTSTSFSWQSYETPREQQLYYLQLPWYHKIQVATSQETQRTFGI